MVSIPQVNGQRKVDSLSKCLATPSRSETWKLEYNVMPGNYKEIMFLLMGRGINGTIPKITAFNKLH